jgi:hypothetical protein
MQEQKDYVGDVLNGIVDALPKVLGALLIFIIGYIIAKVVSGIVRKFLEKAKLNEHLQAGKGGNLIQRAIPDPAGLLSTIVFWLLFLFAISVAASALGIPALVDIVHGIYAYVPNIIAAFLIFLVASAISAGAAALVTNTMGDTPTGKLVATSAPVVVMGIATFMILNQLKIAPEIVTITYAGLVATAVLAFGLGGKDAASRMFMELYMAGKQNTGTAKQDFKKGAAEARSKTQNIRNQI